MANEKNLIPAKKGDVRNPFKGRGKGTKNRSTLASYWLDKKMDVVDPITGKTIPGTAEDAVFLSLRGIALNPKSKESDRINAIKELFEMKYGKAVQPFRDETDKADEIVAMFPKPNEIETGKK